MVEIEAERRKDERWSAREARVGAILCRTRASGAGPTSWTEAMAREHWLQVWNQGPAIATQLHLTCDQPGFIRDHTEVPRILRPGVPARVGMNAHIGEVIPRVTIWWVDENGPQWEDVQKVWHPEG